MAASSRTPIPALASDPPRANAGDSSIDQALTLLLADETEAALRWGAATLQRDPSTSGALMVTSRLLERMGRTRAAVEGLRTAVRRAIDDGDLPLAIAAIDDLRALGEDVGGLLDDVSATFSFGSPRLEDAPAPLSPHFDDFQPLSSFLAGPALASKATQIVQAATRADGGSAPEALPPVARLPLFGALPKDALRDLLSAFEVITVPAGHCLMEEGDTGAAAYLVARGEVVLRRAAGTEPPLVLARLGSGEFFGEVGLVSDTPRAAGAVTTRPSILLRATREALNAVARNHPIVAVELAAHCHRRLAASLGRMAPLLAALPEADRALLISKFATRTFRKGERLTTKGEEVGGFHLVASGAVAVVAHDGTERVALATLPAGETIGEVELVLCRRASADAIALQPTVTLFLSREDFTALVMDHPALVHSLYLTAVRRHGETAQALESAVFATHDHEVDGLLVDEPFVAEEKRFEAATFTEESETPPVVALAEPTASVASPSGPISTPPPLPSMLEVAEPSARITSVTAPFPPPMVSVPSAVEVAAPATAAAVAAASPSSTLLPAALPRDPELAKVVASPAASIPRAPFSARAALEEISKSQRLSRFSTMAPLMAASKPPVRPAPSRSRVSWVLPPAAVLAAFAAVAVIGFALAAPFSNRLNTAAASGGEAAPADVPAAEPASEPAPGVATIVVSPPVAVSAQAPPLTPQPASAPAKVTTPAARPRGVAPAPPLSPPSAVGATAETAPPVSASKGAPAIVRESKARTVASGGDEFGGRE